MSYQEWCNVLNCNSVLVTRYFWYKVEIFFKGTIVDGPLRKTKYYDISIKFQGRESPYVWLFTCCKTKSKKIFLCKNICAFYKIYIICWIKCFYTEKTFYWKKLFFYREKYIWNVKTIYLIWEIYFCTENFCVTNKVGKSFFSSQKIYLLKLRGELNNLVRKVLEAPNLWHSLN